LGLKPLSLEGEGRERVLGVGEQPLMPEPLSNFA